MKVKVLISLISALIIFVIIIIIYLTPHHNNDVIRGKDYILRGSIPSTINKNSNKFEFLHPSVLPSLASNDSVESKDYSQALPDLSVENIENKHDTEAIISNIELAETFSDKNIPNNNNNNKLIIDSKDSNSKNQLTEMTTSIPNIINYNSHLNPFLMQDNDVIPPTTTTIHYMHMVDLSYNIDQQEKAVLFPLLQTYHTSEIRSNLAQESSYENSNQDKPPLVDKNEPDLSRINLLQKALNTGDLCIKSTVNEVVLDLTSSISELIIQSNSIFKSFIEITSSPIEKSLALVVASKYPNLTSIMIQHSETSSDSYDGVINNGGIDKDEETGDNKATINNNNDNSDCKLNSARSNLFVSTGLHSKNNEFTNFDCLQVITDFSSFVDGQLPFEYEVTLGKILCRCNDTIVSKFLPATAYFSYWESVVVLLKSSIAAVKNTGINTCEVGFDIPSIASAKMKSSHVSVHRYSNSTKLASLSGHITVKSLLSLPLLPISKQHLITATMDYVTSSLFNFNCSVSNKCDAAFSWVGDTIISGSIVREINATSDNINRRRLEFEKYSSSIDENIISSSNDKINETNIQGNTVTTANTVTISDSNITSTNNGRKLLMYPMTKSTSNSISSNNNHINDVSSTWELSDEFIQHTGSDIMDISKLSSKSKKEFPSTPLITTKPTILSDEKRRNQRILQDRENYSYEKWITAITKHDSLGGEDVIKKSNLIYIFGKQSSLLSVKMAHTLLRSNSNALVISVLTDEASVESHQSLLEVMNIRNNIICNTDLSILQISSLLVSPERADLSILQVDVFYRLFVLSVSASTSSTSLKNDNLFDLSSDLFSKDNHNSNNQQASLSSCGIDLFEELFASMLSLSSLTYIEIPSIKTLKEMLGDMMSKQCLELITDRYKLTENIIKFSTNLFKNGANIHITEIQHSLGIRRRYDLNDIEVEDGHSYNIFRIDIDHTIVNDNSIGLSSRGSRLGISLYSLLHLGIIKEQKKKLLRMFIDLPFWALDEINENGDNVSDKSNHILAWNIFIRLQSSLKSSSLISKKDLTLWYHNDKDSSTFSDSNGNRNRGQVYDTLNSVIGSSLGSGGIKSEKLRSKLIWKLLYQELNSHKGELADGKFSFVEHNSGYGYISSMIAKEFPNSTIISIERDLHKINHHIEILEDNKILNNAVCAKSVEDAIIYKNIYESPELFRFQLISKGLLDSFGSSNNLFDWGNEIGNLLSSAVTSYVASPLAKQVSLAMHTFYNGLGYSSIDYAYSLRFKSNTNIDHKIVSFVKDNIGPYRPLSDLFINPKLISKFDGNINENSDLIRLKNMGIIKNHPISGYDNFETLWLLGNARAKGGETEISITPLYISLPNNYANNNKINRIRIPILRCDIVNMTRHVHHHYDYAKDGHTRTYTMRVEVNDTMTSSALNQLSQLDKPTDDRYRDTAIDLSNSYVKLHPKGVYISLSPLKLNRSDVNLKDNLSLDRNQIDSGIDRNGLLLPAGAHPNQHKLTTVYLYRDRDDFPIPYTSLYGVTLISTLRLGLESSQRDRLFDSFLKLHMYEDMAPWNIVLMGQALDYIDYDTKDFTFDQEVPKAYMVMTVLMNYKRTVEDFKRCGSKAATTYGLPYVSDCVGSMDSKAKIKCPEMLLPVPCADGQCHSDYISCLRSLSNEAEVLIQKSKAISNYKLSNVEERSNEFATSIVQSMKKNIGKFNSNGYIKEDPVI